MIKRIASLALAVLVVGSMTSCILDPSPSEKPPDEDKKSDYKDRTEKWHVLHNINVAYNTMESVPYKGQIDEEFIFFFYDGDVGSDDIPTQWDYGEEIASADEMLNKGPGKRNNPVLSISLELANIEQATWVEFDNIEGFRGETWHRVTVGYNFFIDTTNDIQFITSGTPNAQFTVREQPDGKWKLIRWRDLASG